MNYELNGISRTLPEWANLLGVAESDLKYEMSQGKTLPDIVRAFQTDTFDAKGYFGASLSRIRPSLSTFTSGLPTPTSRNAGCSITGDCRSCMAVARDEYEALHRAHLQSLEAEKKADIRAGKQVDRG